MKQEIGIPSNVLNVQECFVYLPFVRTAWMDQKIRCLAKDDWFSGSPGRTIAKNHSNRITDHEKGKYLTYEDYVCTAFRCAASGLWEGQDKSGRIQSSIQIQQRKFSASQGDFSEKKG